MCAAGASWEQLLAHEGWAPSFATSKPWLGQMSFTGGAGKRKAAKKATGPPLSAIAKRGEAVAAQLQQAAGTWLPPAPQLPQQQGMSVESAVVLAAPAVEQQDVQEEVFKWEEEEDVPRLDPLAQLEGGGTGAAGQPPG